MRQHNQRCQLPIIVFQSNYGSIVNSFRDMTRSVVSLEAVSSDRAADHETCLSV